MCTVEKRKIVAQDPDDEMFMIEVEEKEVEEREGNSSSDSYEPDSSVTADTREEESDDSDQDDGRDKTHEPEAEDGDTSDGSVQEELSKRKKRVRFVEEKEDEVAVYVVEKEASEEEAFEKEAFEEEAEEKEVEEKEVEEREENSSSDSYEPDSSVPASKRKAVEAAYRKVKKVKKVKGRDTREEESDDSDQDDGRDETYDPEAEDGDTSDESVHEELSKRKKRVRFVEENEGTENEGIVDEEIVDEGIVDEGFACRDEKESEKVEFGRKAEEKGKAARRSCPTCGKAVVVLTKHMRTVHGLSPEDARRASSSVMSGKGATAKCQCAFSGCGMHVVRMDRHLTRVHHLEKGTEKFEKYNDNAKSVRANVKHEILKAVQAKEEEKEKKEERAKRTARMRRGVQSESEGESSTDELCTGETSEGGLRGDVVADPTTSSGKKLGILERERKKHIKAPKVVADRMLGEMVNDLEVFARFSLWMDVVDGGEKKKMQIDHHIHQVARCLYQLQDPPTDVKLLFRYESLDIIRNTLLEGNHLLAKPYMAGTIRGWISSLLLFYKFLRGTWQKLECLQVTNEDSCDLDRALARVAQWATVYSRKAAERRLEVHEKDKKELLRPQDYAKLLGGLPALAVTKLFVEAADSDHEVRAPKFVKMRDYLLVQVMLASAQRAGAAANLTVEEFAKGYWLDNNEGARFFVTKTKTHKTMRQGAATLFWSEELKSMADIYVNVLRESVLSGESVFSGKFAPVGRPFFITSNGGPMTSTQVSRRVTEMGRKLCPGLVGNLSGKLIRKSAVSSHRRDSSSSITQEELADQMSHTIGTARANYDVGDKYELELTTAKYLHEARKCTTNTVVCRPKKLTTSTSTATLTHAATTTTITIAQEEPDEEEQVMPEEPRKPLDVSHKKTTSGGGRVFTNMQTRQIEVLTGHLPDNAKQEAILVALQSWSLSYQFNKEQLRSKFRAIRKPKKVIENRKKRLTAKRRR